jgi:ribosomal protein S18 acetylase RimI-like enzyme
LVVRGPARNQGIGSALMSEFLKRMAALGCAEVSVATLIENVGAQRFYRSHGLTDDAVLLEKHL